MNDIMKKQLASCKICQLPYYDDGTTELIIPLYTPDAKQVVIEENKYYIVQLSRSILTPCENDTLQTNWNRGIKPISEFLLVIRTNQVGDMVQFDACGWDSQTQHAKADVYTSLWLPRTGFKVIQEL